MIVESTRRYIDSHGLIGDGERLLVGVSGGLDSMVLIDVLERLGIPFSVAHVNYGLRGSDSDDDALLVRSTCEHRDIGLIEVDVSKEIVRKRSGGSLQALARHIRYRELASIARSEGFDCVAVAHHRDDQVETVLMNALRKAGLDGLAGMRSKRVLAGNFGPTLIRPFLSQRRNELRAYADREGISWREDRSNADRRFLRARVRHDVIPALRNAAGSDIEDEVISMALEIQQLVDDALPGWLPDEIRPGSLRDGRVPLKALYSMAPELRAWLLLRVLRKALPGVPARATSVSAIERLLHGRTGKRIQYRCGSIWKEQDCLRFLPAGPIASLPPREPATLLRMRSERQSSVLGPFGELAWEKLSDVPERMETNNGEIIVDADRLSGQLFIRRWLPGDRLRPFGLEGTKKVKSLLTENKVAPSNRPGIHVLCDDLGIVWVLGIRMDERCRVGPETRRVHRFSYHPPVDD